MGFNPIWHGWGEFQGFVSFDEVLLDNMKKMKNFQVLIVLLASLAQSMIEVEDVAMAEQYFLPSPPLSKPPKITITNINILLTLPSS